MPHRSIHAPDPAGNDEHFELLVIGAGQGGIPLANAFARAGRRVALVEQVHVGGTCINEGCSPTKTVIAGARVAHVMRRSTTYGVQLVDDGGGVQRGPVDARVRLGRVHERKQEIVVSFRSNSERGLASTGVRVILGQARFVGPRTVCVTGAPAVGASSDGGRTLSADLVVINTGLRPAVPQIEGLGNVPYLTSTSILELTDVPEHLIVLGAGRPVVDPHGHLVSRR